MLYFIKMRVGVEGPRQQAANVTGCHGNMDSVINTQLSRRTTPITHAAQRLDTKEHSD